MSTLKADRFTVATSQATGKDERTIRRAAARGAALGDDLEKIAIWYRESAGRPEIEKAPFIYRERRPQDATGAHLDQSRQHPPSRQETATRSPWPFLVDLMGWRAAADHRQIMPRRPASTYS